MHTLLLLLTRLSLSLTCPALRRRDDRGDVPGWVLVTVMTAGLVAALWRFAGPELQSMLRSALGGVSGP